MNNMVLSLDLFRCDVMSLDSQTQRKLFHLFRYLVYHDILKLINDFSLTEDVIQESFMKAIKYGPRTYEQSNMRSWIRQLTKRVALDMLRKNNKYFLMADTEKIMEKSATSLNNEFPESFYENALEKEILYSAFSELSNEHKIILTLRYVEGLTYEEISNVLKISDSATGKRLQRARQMLHKLFIKKWSEM